MSRHEASELACRLGRQAEAVCRHYLYHGKRQGSYWRVGDASNAPGQSLFVRLTASRAGPAGKWQDAATGEFGDLLDLIRIRQGLHDFNAVLAEARRFLSLPQAHVRSPSTASPAAPWRRAVPSVDAARRLFAMSRPVEGTLAATYLSHRGITKVHALAALRFHPRCFYRSQTQDRACPWPALIAAVTDQAGAITGLQRTWLACDGSDKAPLEVPRKALGHLLGNAVRFAACCTGQASGDVMLAGEGLETVLSVRDLLPDMAMLAAGSAAHLGALAFPPRLRRLYVLDDGDEAADLALQRLKQRAAPCHVEIVPLVPGYGDANAELMRRGRAGLLTSLGPQLHLEDALRFLKA